VTALCSALLTYSIFRWGFPPIGFESGILLIALLYWLGVVAAVVAGLLCTVSFLRTRSTMIGPFLCAGLAGLVLVVIL
jgi:hypothetical protein